MFANPRGNWLNTIAVRASYILPILKWFPWWKPRKTRGVVYLPPEKNQNRNKFVFLSFGADPLNHQFSGTVFLRALCGRHWSLHFLANTVQTDISGVFQWICYWCFGWIVVSLNQIRRSLCSTVVVGCFPNSSFPSVAAWEMLSAGKILALHLIQI